MAVQAIGGNAPAPIPPSQRIDSIDALRGLALFGVLAINLETEFRVSIFQQFLPGARGSGLDRHVDAFLDIFLDLKAFAVFSLLFGMGMAIQYERLETNPQRAVLLLRRLLALLGFGLIHLFLIWNGDILTEYAVAGLLVLPLLFAPRWVIAFGAIGCLLLWLAMPLLPPPMRFPDRVWLIEHVAAANRVYGSGGFFEVLAFRIEEVRAFLPLHALILARTLGLFLLGALVWRSGLVRNTARHARALWTCGALLTAAGVALTLATSARWYSGWPPLRLLDVFAPPAATIVLPLGYCGLVLAAGTIGRARGLAWFEPVGRMAFTNYVAQSVILGWVFYGYGLGLFGKIGSAAGMLLAIAIYAAQAVFSRWWLKRFRYGPIEGAWRAAMYGRWPVFRAE